MIRLENQDCKEFLKTIENESVSLVLTDPPYEISRETDFSWGFATGKDTDRFRVSMDFGVWDYAFHGLREVIAECYRVLKKGGTMICFYDVWKITPIRRWFEDAHFKQIRLVEWIKTNPVPLNSKTNYLTNAREIAIVGVKGVNPVFHSEYDNGIYQYGICQDKGRFHTTQKPVVLLEALIKKHSNEGDLVLDCFAGSASTTVAAYNTGRSFIGCEISKEYYEQAIERLRAAGIM